MALRKEPGVTSSIGQQTQLIPVTNSVNTIIPLDSPSGVSDPTYCTSTKFLYNNFAITSEPSANDSPSMLQAASLLNSGKGVWVVRCHDNRVYEGVTSTGSKFFTDKNLNPINASFGINISLPSSFWSGAKIKINNTDVGGSGTSYSTAVNNVVSSSSVERSLETNDGGFSIYTTSAIGNATNFIEKSKSTNLKYKTVTLDSVSADDYLEVNGTVYTTSKDDLPDGASGTVEYINTEPFTSGDNQKGMFDLLLLDKLFTNCPAAVLSIGSPSVTISGISVGDCGSYFSVNSSNAISVKKSAIDKLITSGYIAVTTTNKKAYIYVGDIAPSGATTDNSKKLDGPVTPYKMLAEMASYYKNKEYESTTVTVSASAFKLLTSSLNSCTSSGITLGNESPAYQAVYANEAETVSEKKYNFTITIGNTDYKIGSGPVSKSSVVILSNTAIDIYEAASKLANALPSVYNATCNRSSVSCFILDPASDPTVTSTGSDKPDVNKTTLQTYSDIGTSLFGVILKFNSTSKIAGFKYTYDNSTGLFDVTGTVNNDSYNAKIQFADSTRVDGYGISLYYQHFNESFPQMEIIELGGSGYSQSMNNYLFGDAIPFNSATVSDLDVALSKLKNYKFTKWELLADGGFTSPDGYAVLNKWASQLHMLVDGGTPAKSQIQDVISWRNDLPASTKNILLNHPPMRDNSIGSFSVVISAGIPHIKRILDNAATGNEFQSIFGADRGTLSGRPIYNLTDEDDRNELLSVGINTIYYSDELKLTFVNDNYTLLADEGPLQEENIVRMANAATHVAEMWLELNAVGHFNCLRLRNDIESGVKTTIENRLKSGEPCYKDLIVVCNETNGNDDSKTQVFVDAYLTPFRSVKQVHLFTLVKSVTNEQ